MSPGLVTRTLHLSPEMKKTAGAARRTPRGTVLGGIYRESYWLASIVRKAVGRVGRRSSAEQHVERFCKKLRRHAQLFKRIHDDGGRVLIWVSSHSRRNYTFELTRACLDTLAAVGVGLVIDVYPSPQRW
jgi:hypothetical protein